jgi:hypothetical protein
MRYIVVWRRSPTARYLDVQLAGGINGSEDNANIAVLEGEPQNMPLIRDEADLISYVNSTETEARAVEADLAHRVLGWSIPQPR